jgi:hypothetical protein
MSLTDVPAGKFAAKRSICAAAERSGLAAGEEMALSLSLIAAHSSALRI